MIPSKNMYFITQIKKNVKSLKANLLKISISLIILVHCLPIIITRNIQALPATLRIFLLAWKSCLNQLQKSYLLICLQHFSTSTLFYLSRHWTIPEFTSGHAKWGRENLATQLSKYQVRSTFWSQFYAIW